MADIPEIAGIVLAGGRSSRMGANKALLHYEGKPLLEHMIGLLHDAGCREVFISGDVPGYKSIPDAVRHDGPASAMIELLGRFQNRYERLLFVPVDMPLLAVECLTKMLQQKGSVFYRDHPLPACLVTGVVAPGARSVKDVLGQVKATPLTLEGQYKKSMANINTPQEWEKVVS